MASAQEHGKHNAVFRAYDIRGVADRDLDDDFVTDVGRALGTLLRRGGGDTLVVGRDCRTHSPRLHAALLRGLVSTGAHVIDVGIVPSPVLYFAVHHLFPPGRGSGVEITGSHNPARDNGFKIWLHGGSLHGDRLRALLPQISAADFVTGTGSVRAVDVRPDYEQFVRDRLRLGPRRPSVVVDAGNGTGGEIAVPLLRSLGFAVTPILCEMDGRFPHHPPDPTVPDHLQALIAAVQGTGAELGLAFDGDADRLAVVDSGGRILWGDDLLILLGRAILREQPGATFVCEVKCSRAVVSELEAAGGRVVIWRVGHSEIREKMGQVQAALGGEMSGHLFFAHRYLGYDDAIYAAARLLEILSWDDRTHALSRLYDTLPRLHRTSEIRRPVPDAHKQAAVRAVADALGRMPGVELNDLDGVRALFPDAWALVRASNTEPVIGLRFEATSADRLQAVRAQVEAILDGILAQLADPQTQPAREPGQVDP